MRVPKAVRIFLIALVSASAVTGIHALDAKRQDANNIALSLRWARQMVTQAESLALAADARGQRDPLTWAARLLSQGTDSRIIFASKTQVPTPVAHGETFSLNPQTGIFDYTKIFDMSAGTGIRIRLYTTRTGIFGAKTLLQNDLTVAALFLLIYGFLFFFIERAYSKRELSKKTTLTPENERIEPTLGNRPIVPPALNPLKPLIDEWTTEARKSLTELGSHIRELVRGAHLMARSTRESKAHVDSIQLRIHAELERLHAISKTPDLLTGLATRVEAALYRKKPLDEETQSLLKDLLATALHRAEAVSEAELALEPIVTDADLASNTLEAANAIAAEFAAEIKRTTEGMLEQSRKIADLKNRGA